MLAPLLILVSFFGLATAEYGCSSFAQLTHTSSGCPANQGNPDCSFIQANAAQFCSTTATSWEIINGPNCNLRGASYGCIYAAGLYSTTDQFCCPLIVTGGAPNVTATATVTGTGTATGTASPSVTVTSSGSASASASPSVTANPSLSLNASISSTQNGSVTPTVTPTATVTVTPTATTLINTTTNTTTNMTNQTAISADKSLSENDKIGMGVGISLGIVMLIGCCYFCCLFRFRSKEIEKIERENIERLPSQRRQPRGADHLEIRTPRARGESKV